MKILLSKDVDNLGKMGDIVIVKDGFARNYLIPQKKAIQATEQNILSIQVEAEKRKISLNYDIVRELIYGMPYDEWKMKYQKEATKEQLEKRKNI